MPSENINESCLGIKSHEELPLVAAGTLPQSKNHLAYVLDVRLLLCLIRAIPFTNLLAIHRVLDDGVVFGERVSIVLCLLLELVLQGLNGVHQHPPQHLHYLIVFSLALCFGFLHELHPLLHLVLRELNELSSLLLDSFLALLFHHFLSTLPC